MTVSYYELEQFPLPFFNIHAQQLQKHLFLPN